MSRSSGTDGTSSPTVDASRDRLAIANLAGVLELALDASDSQTMKLSALMDDLSSRLPHEGLQLRIDELCRLGASIPRLAAAYQSGLLALQRVRSGGKQVVTVQHVHVADGGQAVVAAKLGGKGTGGEIRKYRGGGRENDE